MAVAITQTANPAGVATSSSVATYTGVSTGTASNDRVIAVCIGNEAASAGATGVTIDGIAMRLANGTIFGACGAWIYWLGWPTGTTATIAVTFASDVPDTQNHIAVYSITDAKFPPLLSQVDTSTDMDASDPLTTASRTIPVGGGVLAVAACATGTVAKTWANITEDIDANAGTFRFTTATTTTGGTVTMTCTGGTNNEDGVLSYIILEPQAIPDLTVSPMTPAMR